VWSKNLCSTSDLVAKLFIAILANKAFREWGAKELVCVMLAYVFTDCALGVGGHCVFSSKRCVEMASVTHS
jgi:hypothetical protein